MRRVCVPLVSKKTSGPSSPTPQPLSCQPQPLNPQAKQSSRLITSPVLLVIRFFTTPCESTLSLNCTKTESLNGLPPPPSPQTPSRNPPPACAVNCNST